MSNREKRRASPAFDMINQSNMLMISNKEKTQEQPNRAKSTQLGFKLVRYFLNPLNLLIQIGFATRKKGKTALGDVAPFTQCGHRRVSGYEDRSGQSKNK